MKTKVAKPKILKVIVKHIFDDNPDTSYLGEYSDIYDGENPYVIIRVGEHAGEFVSNLPEDYEIPSRGGEFRFFLPNYQNHTGYSDKEAREYAKQDYKRMEGLNNGDWCYIGVMAKAEVVSENGIVQTLTSGGLWGIESNSGDKYIKEIEDEQLNELRGELQSFGFSNRQINAAMKEVDRKEL